MTNETRYVLTRNEKAARYDKVKDAVQRIVFRLDSIDPLAVGDRGLLEIYGEGFGRMQRIVGEWPDEPVPDLPLWWGDDEDE